MHKENDTERRAMYKQRDVIKKNEEDKVSVRRPNAMKKELPLSNEV